MKLAGSVLAVFALSLLSESAQAQGGDSADLEGTSAYTIYSEIDVVSDAWFASTELYVSLNGDWSRPGFLLHAYIGSGEYEYRTEDVPGGRVDGVPISADLMIGYYGAIREVAYWNVLVGVGIEDNELDPNDPSNPVRGSEVGFKVAGEIEADEELSLYYHLEGDYTTAYDTYWSRARLGYNFGKVITGPEGTFFGDETYDSQRVGGFLRFRLPFSSSLQPIAILAGGYEFVDSGEGGGGFGGIGGSEDGAYGTASLQFDF